MISACEVQLFLKARLENTLPTARIHPGEEKHKKSKEVETSNCHNSDCKATAPKVSWLVWKMGYSQEGDVQIQHTQLYKLSDNKVHQLFQLGLE